MKRRDFLKSTVAIPAIATQKPEPPADKPAKEKARWLKVEIGGIDHWIPTWE